MIPGASFGPRAAGGLLAFLAMLAALAAHPARSPRAPDPPAWPHEPPMFKEISDQPWNEVASLGWKPLWGTSRVVRDSSAPYSPPNVLEIRYPVGYPGGEAPGTVALPLAGLSQVYVGLWWKTSPSWQGHESNVNKIQFLFPQSGGDIYMAMYGPQGGPYELRVLPQFVGISSDWLVPNVDPGIVTLGTWHRLEWLLMWNPSSGWPYGICRWWMDGRLVGDYANVPVPPGPFVDFKLSPTWGGVGDVKRQDDYYRYDHIRISGR